MSIVKRESVVLRPTGEELLSASAKNEDVLLCALTRATHSSWRRVGTAMAVERDEPFRALVLRGEAMHQWRQFIALPGDDLLNENGCAGSTSSNTPINEQIADGYALTRHYNQAAPGWNRDSSILELQVELFAPLDGADLRAPLS